MRVIAGRFRSRKLKSVPGLLVRPTPDRLREALFNVLAPRIPGSVFLDAYAGSGAVGIEALSRGARHVILIERSGEALGVLRDNIRELQIEKEVTVVRGRAVAQIPNHPAEICFIDPPYDQEGEYLESLLALGRMRPSLTVAQHPSRLLLAGSYEQIQKFRVLKQGDNSLSFFEPSEAESIL